MGVSHPGTSPRVPERGLVLSVPLPQRLLRSGAVQPSRGPFLQDTLTSHLQSQLLGSCGLEEAAAAVSLPSPESAVPAGRCSRHRAGPWPW